MSRAKSGITRLSPMISFEPTDEERSIVEQVHRFAELDVRPALRQCEEQGLPDGLVQRYLSLHLTSADFDAEVGGLGLSFVGRLLVEEELAWGDPGVAAALPGPGAAAFLLRHAPASVQQRWCDVAADGRTALLLPRRGDSGLQLRRSGERLLLSGALSWVSHGPEADHLLAVAEGEEGPVILWLAGHALRSGFAPADQRLGLRALPIYTLSLESTPCDSDAIVLSGDPARAAVRAALDRGHLLTAAHAVGTSRAACEYAGRYALERKTFGKAIAEHQAVAFMVADMATAVEAARSFVWMAATQLEAGTAAPATLRMAAAHTFESALEVSSAAVQILGGHGYIQDHPVEKWMRDARTLASWWEGVGGPCDS